MSHWTVTALLAAWVGFGGFGCSDEPTPGGAGNPDAVADADAGDSGASDADATAEDAPNDANDAGDSDDNDGGPPLGGPCEPLGADADSAALFDPGCVLEVDLSIDPGEWDALRVEFVPTIEVIAGDCLAEPHQTAFPVREGSVEVGGQRFDTVGIAKRGFVDTLSDDKPSLALHFEGAGPAGAATMILDNMARDPGLINMCLAMHLMAQGGVPAPRCSFARVTVNGFELGIYAHVEAIDAAFLEREFGDASGALYRAGISDFTTTYQGTWSGADPSGLDAAIAALETPEGDKGEGLIEALQPHFDLESFYTFWAAEVMIGHWDGYSGARNNTWVYQDPSDGRLRFVPWGIDSAFATPPELPEGFLPQHVYATGHLAHRLFATERGSEDYAFAMTELLITVWSEGAILDEIDRMYALLLPFVAEADRPAFADAINAKRSWVEQRQPSIEADLNPEPKPWPWAPRESWCWNDVGEVSATFDTSWGTTGWNFLEGTGTLEVDVVSVDDNQGNVSATAFISQLEGDTEGQAVVQVISQDPSGLILVIWAIVAPEDIQSGVSLPLDWRSASGSIGYFQPFAEELAIFGLLWEGVLELEEASTLTGEPIVGTLNGRVFVAP